MQSYFFLHHASAAKFYVMLLMRMLRVPLHVTPPAGFGARTKQSR
jgi:hypothetical protein